MAKQKKKIADRAAEGSALYRTDAHQKAAAENDGVVQHTAAENIAFLRAIATSNEGTELRLPTGERMKLDPLQTAVFRQLITAFAATKKPQVIVPEEVLSTQQAADYLGFSRPHVVKLMEEGELPFFKVGKHRRIAFDVLQVYRRRMVEARQSALGELIRLSQDMELYRDE